jgi:hypothetical protein
VIGAAALTAMAFFAITRFPDELHTRQLQWSNQHAYTRKTAMATVGRENGVSWTFLEFVAHRVPEHDSFAVVIGPGRLSSAPQSLAQWFLMPRHEEYGRPCSADWIVFFGHEPRLEGIALGHVARFERGLSLAKVTASCTH